MSYPDSYVKDETKTRTRQPGLNRIPYKNGNHTLLSNSLVMPNMTDNRFTIAAVISPLVPAAIALAPMLQGENSQFEILSVGLAVITSYLWLFVIGFPLINFLRQMGWLNLPALVIAGVLAGIVVFGLFLQFLGAMLESSASINIVGILWGAVLGLSAALSFGVIAGITRHPNRRGEPRGCA